jgi:hypothetical protein
MFDYPKESGLEIIKELVEDDKSLSRIYGFILYTDADPYVVKVLRDTDFWNALNKISGNNWPIFAVRPLQKGYMKYPELDYKTIGFLYPIWVEPDDNLHVIQDFGLENSKEFPLFVAFMWDDENYLHKITVPILGNDVDSVYKSLKLIVETITEVENKISPENKRSVTVFREVEKELLSQEMTTKIINCGKNVAKLINYLH